MPQIYLLAVYVLTIVVVRVFLTFWPIHSHKIGNLQPHHYMHGLILIALYFIIPWPILLAVGSALVVDEVPLFFIFGTWNWPDNHWKQYHSWQSVLGVTALSLIGLLAIWL
jgi:hypothetical protein